MTEFFAFSALGILGALVLFQITLILGAPIGRYAWGGAHTVLPKNLRIASATSLVLYVVFAIAIMDRAEIISVLNPVVSIVSMWVITVYFFFGILLNFISKSVRERVVMTPIATLLAFLFLFVAIS